MGWLGDRRTVDRTDSTYQADGVAISDEETQWVLPFLGGVVVCPEVETSSRGHGGSHVSLVEMR